MENNNRQYAYFAITGDFNPDEITARVGVRPTKVWRQGEIDPVRQVERKYSRWSLYSRLGHAQPLETHILDAVSQLDLHPSAFMAISHEYGGYIQLIAYWHEYPGLHFDQIITGGLARYSLEVDFDFYGQCSILSKDA